MISKDRLLLLLRAISSALMLFLLCPFVLGATLHGSTYDLELKTLNNVVVEIDTTPVQRYVSKNGTYSFSVDPGSYFIRARYSPDNFTTLTSLDRIKIQKEGDYVFDLFLLPDLDEDKDILSDFDVDAVGAVEQPSEVNYAGQVLTGAILFVIIIMVYFLVKRLRQNQSRRVIAGVIDAVKSPRKALAQKRQSTSVFKERKRIREEQESKEEEGKEQENKEQENNKARTLNIAQHNAVQELKSSEEREESSKTTSEQATKVIHVNEFADIANLDGDLLAVMQFIKREGGRTTQKDLRREIPYSEAKISLMISELEHKKLVKRIKKGRGNIIILNQ
ncbi:hypothetical protein HY772_05235 [Candidatus Woesearchaeota archaeon]|nr:hypothetical protein [Candidatus Woesearchaeota archaeon]